MTASLPLKPRQQAAHDAVFERLNAGIDRQREIQAVVETAERVTNVDRGSPWQRKQ